MIPTVAVIGMGYWGKNLVRNMYQLGALRVVCDEDASREALVATAYPGVRFSRNASEVLGDSGIDAVVIATPAVTHYELVGSALIAGKDVLVEKPLALTVDQGSELVRIAGEYSRILMVGHVLRYHPAVRAIQDLIAQGKLGKIQYLYSNRLNIGRIRTEENILWSFAPHDVSVMLAMVNEEPEEIYCQGAHYLNASVADVTTSEFVFRSGIHAHIFVSWLHPFKEQRLVVVGSESMAVFDDTAPEKLMVYPHRVAWSNGNPTAIRADGVPVGIDSTEPLTAECMHFLECIRERRAPVTDGAEGLRVLRVLDACQRALETEHRPRPLLRIAHRETGRKQGQSQRRSYLSHPSAVIDEPCQIGPGTKIWHFSHIMKGARIGENCSLGQNCNVAEDTRIGNNVKIQNNVSIYAGTIIEDDVFLGPSCVLTNVSNPRSQVNRHSVYEPTVIRRGATIGANATVVCGVEIGRYAFIAAGAVVTRNVPEYALMIGNPARQAGWMSRHGHRLVCREGILVCPESGLRYQEVAPGMIRCLDIDEEQCLPPELTCGTRSYADFRRARALAQTAQ